MTDPRSLKVGDVVRSESFVRVEKRTDYDGTVLFLELDKRGPDIDKSRAHARFVITHIEEAFNHGGHNDPPAEYPSGRTILAKRLKEDGTFDPDGEIIRFLMSYTPYPSLSFHNEYVVWDDKLEVLDPGSIHQIELPY